MTCRSSTRNPVQVRAVQFYSSLVDTNGCGHVWRDRGRVRPATVIGLRPAAAQLRPENSAGCGFGQMSRIKCHALLSMQLFWIFIVIVMSFLRYALFKICNSQSIHEYAYFQNMHSHGGEEYACLHNMHSHGTPKYAYFYAYPMHIVELQFGTY
jgi:hypothetical protein